jgi:phospholipase/carboxylesterase
LNALASTWEARDPHRGQRVATAGRPLAGAPAAVLVIHGRGATAESILSLADELDRPDFAYLAPQAYGHAWYPYSFLAPLEENEPGLTSALAVLGDLLERVGAAGIPPERTVFMGFSQGACLASELAARNAKRGLRLGGIVAFSGGLIGPPGTPRDYPGSLAGTPVFLGCSDRDPHIPRERVDESARVLTALGGAVTERIYPRMGHTINEDEIEFARDLLDRVLEGGGA